MLIAVCQVNWSNEFRVRVYTFYEYKYFVSHCDHHLVARFQQLNYFLKEITRIENKRVRCYPTHHTPEIQTSIASRR